MVMQSCEMEASGEKAAVSGDNGDSIMRLAWALVHSRNGPDVQRGISMLEGTLCCPLHPCKNNALQQVCLFSFVLKTRTTV